MSFRDDFVYAKTKWPVRRGFCRRCGIPRPKGVRWVTTCPACRDLVIAWPTSWGAVCARVHARDKGICADCGCDCGKIERVLRKTIQEGKRHCRNSWAVFVGAKRAMGFPSSTHYWEAHHVNPVAAHGAAESIDELVTLCVPCHKQRHRTKATFKDDSLFGA